MYNRSMTRSSARRTILATLTITTAVPGVASAVILAGSKPRHTTPPTGALANSGWQYQAQFAGFLGTPVSSKYFLTAQHIGGAVGWPVDYGGQTYFTDQAVNVPGTDLRLWRISGTFPAWAPLWNPSVDGQELNKRFVVYGRGTQRGETLWGPIGGPLDPNIGGSGGAATPTHGEAIPNGYEVKGYTWGADDRVQSWGENAVRQVVDFGPDFGQYMYFTFDANGLLNEAHLSNGDSGGGAFIRSPSGAWKLAGINYGVDGPYRLALDSAPFYAALLDTSGLYAGDPPDYVMPSLTHRPNGGYISRVSASRAFIESVINAPSAAAIPEPASAGLATGGVALLLGRRRRRRGPSAHRAS